MAENRQQIEKERLHIDALWNGDFDAPLKTGVELVRGTGAPTFTRATVGWTFNENGLLSVVPSGAPRFTGARMVHNRITYSENLSNAAWTKRGAVSLTGSQADPKGGSTAYQIDNIGATGVNDIFASVTDTNLAQGRRLYVGFWLKRVSTSGTLRIGNPAGATLYGRFDIDLSALPDAWVFIDESSPYVVPVTEHTVSNVNSFGFHVYEFYGATVSVMIWGVTVALWEQVNKMNAANEYVSSGVKSGLYHGAVVDGVKYFDTDNGGVKISQDVLKWALVEPSRTNNLKQCRDLTLAASGSATGLKCWDIEGTGSELLTNVDFSSGLTGWTNISSGSGTATASGGSIDLVGVDGSNRGAIEQIVTGLDTSKTYVMEMNVTSLTSGQITMAVGQATGTGSFENYYIFASSTGVWRRIVKPPTSTLYIKAMTYASGGVGSIDNMSFKEAKINVEKDATGIDGVPNSCSTITAAVDDGAIYQNFVMAASSRTFSVYIKRKSGFGSISLTRDGGASWTDVTSEIKEGVFTRVAIRNTTPTDPTCGIKLGTAGDSVVVDCMQDEAGAVESSPIITTSATVTRNHETFNYSVANLNDTRNTAYHEAIPSDTSTYDRRSIFFTGFTNNRAGFYYFNRYAAFGDGSTVRSTSQAAYTRGDKIRAIVRWDNATVGTAFVNGQKLSDVSSISVTPTTVDIGTSVSTSSMFIGNVKNVKIYKRLLTDEQCINATLIGVD